MASIVAARGRARSRGRADENQQAVAHRARAVGNEQAQQGQGEHPVGAASVEQEAAIVRRGGELAVAAAISLFGFSSGAALATVVGVLIEVPVMLSVVKIVNASKHWYEMGPAVTRRREIAGGSGVTR